MILSDIEIKEALDSGEIVCTPLMDESIQPASIDARLGDHFLMLDTSAMTHLTLSSKVEYREEITDTFTIPPKSFILATTIEYIEIPSDIACFVEGRSSIGRLGLFIQNAGWVDPGFKGKITLELYNADNLPIKLEAGRRICQFVFSRTGKPAQFPYGHPSRKSKYQGQDKAVGSRIAKDIS